MDRHRVRIRVQESSFRPVGATPLIWIDTEFGSESKNPASGQLSMPAFCSESESDSKSRDRTGSCMSGIESARGGERVPSEGAGWRGSARERGLRAAVPTVEGQVTSPPSRRAGCRLPCVSGPGRAPTGGNDMMDEQRTEWTN
jgi:hypothetical protein